VKGKIVLVPFPFTDLTAAKLRPALVIYEAKKDAVLAFISSKIPSKLSEVDILISKNNPGFKRAGLKADSVIKLDKIATVELGELDEELRKQVNQKLRRAMEI